VSTTLDPETRETADAPADPADAHPTGLTCPSCGAETSPGQLMCLECGARLALDYQRPPTWRLPAAIAGVVVLLAGAALAFALAKATDDAGRTTANAPTQPVSNAAPADTPATGPATSPASSTTTPAAAPPDNSTAPTTSPAPTPAPTSPAGWPEGKSAYTVIVASLPSKEAAEKKLDEAKAAGISGAALLHSDDFESLRPGYWVVFDGQFDTVEAATSQAEQDRTKGSFGDAYPRWVSEDGDSQP
jgi:cell division septation protein DedD